MTFCTACASPIGSTGEPCPACGARGEPTAVVQGSAPTTPEAAHRSALMRLLYLAPVLMLFALGGGLAQRHTAEQAWLASAYAAAADAATAGDLVTAREGFSAIAGYRDAASRAQEMETRLEPLEASYIDGIEAIERGEYAAAVALLEPVVEEAPGLNDAVLRLEDARNLLASDLRRDVDAAETVRDWPSAEAILRELVALDGDDAESRERLATLQREHGPIVLGKNRALWLVAPDGSEARQLTDALHVIWPVWSPDRTKIAFLAPDPDDPMGNVSLHVVGLDGSTPRKLVDGVSAHAAPTWSPDGTKIAYTSFAGYDPVYESGSIGIRMVEVASGVETDLTGNEYDLAFNPTWSPDGSEIAFIVKHQGLEERPQHAPGDVFVVDLESRDTQNLTEGAVRDVWSVAWSPIGDAILLYSLFGQTWYEPPSTSIRILERPTGEIRQIARIEDRPTMPFWSPDGARFAYTTDDRTIVLSDTAGNQETLKAEEALSGEITWSPDGSALLLAPWDADTLSTIVDLSGASATMSSVSLEFDSSPPFISPPQWGPATAIPPEDNPSIETATANQAPSA